MMCFWIYGHRNTSLDKCLKSPTSENPSRSDIVKRAETRLKSERQYVYQIYWSLWRQLGLIKFLSVICKFSGLFVNSLTANDKYSLLNRSNLYQQFQMQLSQKPKIMFNFFLPFLNLDSILTIFKKSELHTWCIFELMDSKNGG